MEWCRMTRDKLQGLSKQELTDRARKKGIAGCHGMRKEELIASLLKQAAKAARPKIVKTPAKRKTPKKSVRSRPQLAAARDTNGSPSAEEQIERSKYDTGIPTKD